MLSEEQMHVQFLKERAQSIGLTFDQYMLFLIFETLEHAAVLNNQQSFTTPWEEEYMQQQNMNGKNENQEI